MKLKKGILFAFLMMLALNANLKQEPLVSEIDIDDYIIEIYAVKENC